MRKNVQKQTALLLAILFLLADSVYAGEEGSIRTLQEFLREALSRNPQLEAARERWEASRKRIPQSSSLPDPTAGYMIMGQDLETRLGPQKDVFEVEQMVPFPGKLVERHRMAVADAMATEAQRKGVERDLILKVSQAYAEVYAIDATVAVVEEIKETLQKFEGIAQARYASGKGSQRDVAKAQAEVSDTLQRLFVLRQQRETTAAFLNALINRDPGTPLGPVAPPRLPSLSMTLEDLVALAQKQRPELGEASALLVKSRHAYSLAKFEYVPDLSIGFQYVGIENGMTTDPNDGQDAWMIPLKVTLPLWQNRIGAAVQEAKRNLEASRADLQQVQNMSAYDVKDAYYRFTSARQIVGLYENALIPEAELAFRSDQAGYEGGTIDVLNLVDSERVLLNAKVAYHQALADALKSFAALERAVGTDLEDKGDIR